MKKLMAGFLILTSVSAFADNSKCYSNVNQEIFFGSKTVNATYRGIIEEGKDIQNEDKKLNTEALLSKSYRIAEQVKALAEAVCE